jgi:hypothetical protein
MLVFDHPGPALASRPFEERIDALIQSRVCADHPLFVSFSPFQLLYYNNYYFFIK